MANAYSLDLELSSSQYAYIADGDQTGLDISGDITFEGWVKLEQLPSTAGTAFVMASKWNATVSQEYLFFFGSDDKFSLYYDTTTTTPTLIQSDAVGVDGDDVGEWVHFAAAVDVSAKTAALYKNAGLIASSLTSGDTTSIESGAASFAIGANFSSGSSTNYFDGKVDEVRIFSDIRSAGEILANVEKTTGFAVGTDDLVDIWRFENGYSSLSGNNDLTKAGSPDPVFSTDVPFTEGNFLAFL